MRYLPDILALMIAIAGWFYLFYSRAAQRLSIVEDRQANHRRIRLRQANGLVLLLLAISLYAGYHTVNTEPPTQAFFLVWMAVMGLLLASILLVMADLRLTMKLRRRQRQRDEDRT